MAGRQGQHRRIGSLSVGRWQIASLPKDLVVHLGNEAGHWSFGSYKRASNYIRVILCWHICTVSRLAVFKFWNYSARGLRSSFPIQRWTLHTQVIIQNMKMPPRLPVGIEMTNLSTPMWSCLEGWLGRTSSKWGKGTGQVFAVTGSACHGKLLDTSIFHSKFVLAELFLP